MANLLSRRTLLQNLGVATITLVNPIGDGLRAFDRTVTAFDFGARPDGSDAAPGFAKAIAELARRAGGRLIIPRGTYTFAADSGVCLPFNGMSDVDIEAEGAEFVFRGLARPLNFRNCRNVRVRGLTISWARPPFSQGDVADVASDSRSAVIALDEITPADGWTRVEAIGEYDRTSQLIAKHGLDVYGAVDRVEPIDARHVRLRFNRPLPLARAKTLVLRHAIYEAHAIEMRTCADMAFEKVVIRSAPGMGFVAGLTRNISVKRCEIAPVPNSGLFMSTTADAVHFGNCSGEVLIQDSLFARMGDDAVNVNTSYWRITERPDRKSAIVSQWHGNKFWEDDKPALGDRFGLTSASTLELTGEAEIDETHLIGPAPTERLELRFTEDTGENVNDLVYDEARSPKLVIRTCRFENNRARGVLAHKNARIENNLFLNQAAQGIVLAPDAWWMEGPEIAGVQITGNVFDGVDRWDLRKGAIMLDAVIVNSIGKAISASGYPNHDLALINNEFRNFNGPKILLRGVQQ